MLHSALLRTLHSSYYSSIISIPLIQRIFISLILLWVPGSKADLYSLVRKELASPMHHSIEFKDLQSLLWGRAKIKPANESNKQATIVYNTQHEKLLLHTTILM